MARESYDNCFDSGNSRLLNISEKNDENCLSASLKHQPQHLVEKSVSPAGNTVCNGHGENGHDFVDVGAYLRSGEIDLDFDRVTCFATQEKGSSDDSSLLAIRKSRTNIITAIEEPIIEDSHAKENRMQKSIPIPESGMIDLSSANTIFMQSRSSNAEPLYTHKQLPPFLQETLDQSLSRLTIMIGSDKFLEEKSVVFIDYTCEEQLADLTALITKDLSEPYSIYTYRYFLHNWPHLSFLAYCDDLCVGAIVCKLDQHRKDIWRGYIAMLAVHKDFRRFKIGTKLVQKSIRRMIEQGCDEIVLETEVTNKAALNLYENLGFIRDKRLLRYYLNGVDAWRLKLWLV